MKIDQKAQEDSRLTESTGTDGSSGRVKPSGHLTAIQLKKHMHLNVMWQLTFDPTLQSNLSGFCNFFFFTVPI